MNPTSAKPSKRRAANTSVRKASEREKCTLLLDADTSVKLSVAGHLRGLDRSTLVNQLLADALRYVVISIRGQSSDSASLTVSERNPFKMRPESAPIVGIAVTGNSDAPIAKLPGCRGIVISKRGRGGDQAVPLLRSHLPAWTGQARHGARLHRRARGPDKFMPIGQAHWAMP